MQIHINKLTAALAVAAAAFLCATHCAEDEASPENVAPKKAVAVVYDFASDFDKNELGAKLSRMLYDKLENVPGVELIAKPDFDEIAAETGFKPALDTEADKIRERAVKDFSAGIVFWGRLDLDKDGTYTIHIKALDFRKEADGRPTDLSRQTKNKFEFKLIAEDFLSDFFSLPKKRPNSDYAPVGENLIKNPSFEEADDSGMPKSWSRVDDRDKDSIKTADRGDGKGKCLLFDVPDKAAQSYGVTILSDWFEVKKGDSFRVRLDVKAGAPEIIMFVKGYNDKLDKFPVEVARYQKNVHLDDVKKGEWASVETDVFTLENPKFDTERARLVIMAYGAKGGKVWFDDVEIKRQALKNDAKVPHK